MLLKDLRENKKIWLYGGIGAAVIVIGLVIFFFVTPAKSPQATTPTATPSAPTSPTTVPMALPSSSITFDIQKIKSGPRLVVQWENLPDGTAKINVFRAPTENGIGVLVGSVDVPPSSSGGGSGSLNIPNQDQGGYYSGTANGSGGAPLYNSPPAPPSETPSGPAGSSGGSGGSNGSGSSGGSGSDSGSGSNSGSGSGSSNSSSSGSSGGSSSSSSDSSGGSGSDGSSSSSNSGGSSDGSGGSSSSSNSSSSSGGSGDSSGGSSDGSGSSPSSSPSSTPPGDDTSTIVYPSQASLAWNGSYYNVENGLYTYQDMVYISGVTNGNLSNVTVYCSYANYSTTPTNFGYGNYEISGLSSHGCNIPNSINYLDLGGHYGDGLNISINAPAPTF